jgi:hypothetical protein
MKHHIEPPPQTFISPLLELRDYYARLVEEYETLYNQARSQLNNVEGLLSSWSAQSQTNSNVLTVELVNEMLSSPPEDLLLSASAEISDEESTDLETPDSQYTDESTTSSDPEVTSQSREKSLYGVDIPMIEEFRSLTRIEAIRKVLEQHLGTVCHIDFIVRSLYGDLTPHAFKVVKGRVQSSLTQGRERQVWFGIPNEPGCYTLDLGLVAANKNGHATSANTKKKKPVVLPKTKVVPMLQEFEGLFLIDALTLFFRKHPGKVFSVAEVITGLYGQLDPEEIREVKSKVLNELSRGYRTGRFSRMPDTVGFYTYQVPKKGSRD